jgi:phosphonate transport system ATP-binding protein
MIIVRNLSKRFQDGKQALSAVSFQVDAGDFIAIVGGSGSGKTTLLKCMSLKETWDQGQYIIDGKDISKAGFLEKWRLRRSWVYIGDTPNVNPNRTGLQNVLTSYILAKAPWKMLLGGRGSSDDHLRAMDYLDKVGLIDKAHMKASKMSGGEKQRVGIAKSLVSDPKIIFADEPIAGLDPISAARVLEDLQSISRKQGVTIVCTLSNLELAEKYASRLWGIHGGRIVADVTGRRLTVREKLQIFPN